MTTISLCPGAFHSGFQNSAKMQNSANFDAKLLDVKTIAKIGYKGLMKNKTVIIPGLKEKIMFFAERFAPRNVVVRMSRHVVREKNEIINGSIPMISSLPDS